MKNTIMTTIIIGAGIAVSQNTLANENYVCLNNGAERKISIVYDTLGQAVPCEVTYEKGEGIQSLWRAENEVGYCETKAAEFIEKQRSWGWDCTRLTP